MNNKQFEFISTRAKSWYVFEGNYDDLCGACDELANPTERYTHNNIVWIMHEDAHLKMLGIERKFHNFLASAKTLVDHTRVFMKNFSDTQPYLDFETRRNQIGNSSVVKLCHDIRNYFLHQKNPMNNYLIDQTWYENENVIVARGFVRISKESLEEYSNWSKMSKQVIQRLEHPLNVRELADEYFGEVSKFNRWIDTEFSEFLGKT